MKEDQLRKLLMARGKELGFKQEQLDRLATVPLPKETRLYGRMANWTFLHPQATPDHLGFIPNWLNPDDPRPAAVQLGEGYVFGSWQPFEGFKMPDPKTGVLTYPGDPPQRPFAKCEFHDETVFMYNHAWVSVVQKDGSFEVCRMD
jgi:hypothetical protein